MAFLDLDGLTRFKNKLSAYLFANEYSSSATYAVGDYCSYEGKVYKCVTATASEAWTPSHWSATKILAEVFGKLDSNLGAANSGKFLTIDTNGDIVPVSMSVWNGGSF